MARVPGKSAGQVGKYQPFSRRHKTVEIGQIKFCPVLFYFPVLSVMNRTGTNVGTNPMNMNQRYAGKTPALLIVPNTGTKQGWVNRLHNKFEYADSYIFRVLTPNAELERQISTLPARFRNIFVLNNPLPDYSSVIRAASEKGLNIVGIHLFRKRRRVSLHPHELHKWNNIIANHLANS